MYISLIQELLILFKYSFLLNKYLYTVSKYFISTIFKQIFILKFCKFFSVQIQARKKTKIYYFINRY